MSALTIRFASLTLSSSELDLAAAGFARVAPKATGRPGYAPGDLLKLYIYGYLNRVRSSRRLEAEFHRNIEVIWPADAKARLQDHRRFSREQPGRLQSRISSVHFSLQASSVQVLQRKTKLMKSTDAVDRGPACRTAWRPRPCDGIGWVRHSLTRRRPDTG
jgi:hypothetical protein